ncbi:hypothetical protein O181_000804 [Austropuccinia psidii MF-1]|uniref:Uncharacterized protein n=1 Tax=Austropuccinia psidii MF-1 TaxID=1389203 RepID=A0A9Q3B983_9BASI|nr:hypothetical protein [Austropuccinia psidii MF-1]
MRLRCPPSPPSPLLTLPHPSLIFSAAYNPYTPMAPSRYSSDGTLNPPNPLCHLPSLCLHSTLPTCLQRCPHTSLIISATYHPYAPAGPSTCLILSAAYTCPGS